MPENHDDAELSDEAYNELLERMENNGEGSAPYIFKPVKKMTKKNKMVDLLPSVVV